jgi:RIO kinase 1
MHFDVTPADRPSAETSDHHQDPALAGIDPRFVFDFRPLEGPDDATLETSSDAGASADRRWSTYWDVERLCRGPEPVPDWVVTDRAAVDTELGILKTGKEADVYVLERAVEQPGGASSLLAAKRYRSEEHRTFHRSSAYSEGRRVRNTRDARAMAKRTAHGRAVAAGQWASAEWETLKRFWTLGLPVPYPVQIDGTEILMELVTVGEEVAPRLAQTRPERPLLTAYFDQLREAMTVLAREGVAHGDLSPYNILAAGDRLVIIDLPQAVDLVANPAGADFLMRDCHNVCAWFRARGLDVDEDALFGELLAVAF